MAPSAPGEMAAPPLANCNVCAWDDATPGYRLYNVVVIGFLLPLIGVFGTVGNGLAVFVYSRPVMRSSANHYLCALALSDICVVLFAFFLYFLLAIECAAPSVALVYAAGTPYIFPLSMVAQTCSVYFVVAAAVDCFVCSVLPVRCRNCWCTTRHAKMLIVLVITFALIFNLTHAFETYTVACWEARWQQQLLMVLPTKFRLEEKYILIYYTYLYSAIMALGPLVLLIVLNASIIVNVCCKASSDNSEDTVTLILVVFLFIFCNSLALIINLLEADGQLGAALSFLVDLSNLLVVTNSSFNFIIYYAFGSSFRHTLKFFLRSGRRMIRDRSRRITRRSVVLRTAQAAENGLVCVQWRPSAQPCPFGGADEWRSSSLAGRRSPPSSRHSPTRRRLLLHGLHPLQASTPLPTPKLV